MIGAATDIVRAPAVKDLRDPQQSAAVAMWIAEITTKVNLHQEVLVEHASRLTSVERRVQLLETSSTDYGVRITALETGLGAAEGDITTLEGAVADHETRISTLETDLATVTADLATLEGEHNTLATLYATHDHDVIVPAGTVADAAGFDAGNAFVHGGAGDKTFTTEAP